MAGLAGLEGLLPNPLTPLAFLPPDAAWQSTVSMFVLVACLTVMVWDVLNNLRGDHLLLTRRKFGLPTAVYFFSRITTLAYILGTVIVNTAPIGNGNCKKAGIIANAFYPAAIPSSSLLLFFQVRAMYLQRRYWVAFFGFLWLAVLGTSVGILTNTFAISIGPTDFCVTFANFKPYYTAPLVVMFVYDTTLFLATVFRVYQCSMADTDDIKANVETFVFGRHLPTLSKALLQNGQAYFMTTVAVSFTSLVLYYIGSLPQAYRLIMGIPDVVLINVMACRIYRNTRLGIFELPATRSFPPSNSAIKFTSYGSARKPEEKAVPRVPAAVHHRIDLQQYSRSDDSSRDIRTATVSDNDDLSPRSVTHGSRGVIDIGPYQV